MMLYYISVNKNHFVEIYEKNELIKKFYIKDEIILRVIKNKKSILNLKIKYIVENKKWVIIPYPRKNLDGLRFRVHFDKEYNDSHIFEIFSEKTLFFEEQ